MICFSSCMLQIKCWIAKLTCRKVRLCAGGTFLSENLLMESLHLSWRLSICRELISVNLKINRKNTFMHLHFILCKLHIYSLHPFLDHFVEKHLHINLCAIASGFASVQAWDITNTSEGLPTVTKEGCCWWTPISFAPDHPVHQHYSTFLPWGWFQSGLFTL